MAASTPTTESDAPSAVVGLVLAAGAGRRMGGPKALIGPLAEGGRTPLARVCDWVHEAGCERVIAVIGAEADAVRAALDSDPAWGVGACGGVPDWLTLAEASDWSEGMGASLRTGLAAARRAVASAALVTLVDLPDVRASIYEEVLGQAGGASGVLARASYDGRPGHPVLLGRDWWDAAAASAVGDRGARGLFATTPHLLVECGHLGTGLDADTPA